MKNISDVGDLCTGCGTCAAVCPLESVVMRIDPDRGVYETLVEGGCDECGLCLKVCPGIGVDFTDLNMGVFGREPEDILMGNYEECYIAHSRDENRYNASSGGMISQMLIYLLEEGLIDGALVTRMNPERPLEPEPFIARTPEEVVESRGSKYCPVPANVALREILERPGRYAVVGLPCHIHGVRKAERINRKLRERIVYHMGIVCNHTPSFKATLFLLEMLGVDPDDVKSIRYRGEGWPGSLRVETGSGEILLLPEYWGSGFGQLFMPERCRLCVDHMAELSDISFADPWLKELEDEKMGRTLIIVRRWSERFVEVLKSGNCEMDKIKPEKALLSQISNIYMKKKSCRKSIYNGSFPERDFIDRIILSFEPSRLKIPWSLKKRYMVLYSMIVALKARMDFLGDSE